MDKSLFKWGIEHSDPNNISENQKTHFDPELIEQILGKSDAIKMKEAAQIAYQDPSASFEERINAMDRLEFLVEILDNANDLKPLDLWHIIMSGLDESNSLICQKTASIIGTALQNNEPSQSEFVRIDGISLLLDTINKCTCPKSLSKLLFSLSSSVQNCISGWNLFLKHSGIDTILLCITRFSSEESVIMRILSFIRRSLEQFDSFAVWNRDNHLISIIEEQSLGSLYSNSEYIQDCLNIIKSYQ